MGAGPSVHVRAEGTNAVKPNDSPSCFPVQELNGIAAAATQQKGVGVVLGHHDLERHDGALPPPPDTLSATRNGGRGQQFAWFVENLERPGSWDPYNEESSARLESAFFSQQTTCMVVAKRHAYQVDLLTMEQQAAPGASGNQQQQRVRRVCRAPAESVKDPITGETRWQLVQTHKTDPFEDADAEEHYDSEADKAAASSSNRIFSDNNASGDAADGAAVVRSVLPVDSTFPQMIRVVQPQTTPIYALSLTPSLARQSPEARAACGDGVLALTGGKEGKLTEWNVDTGSVTTRYNLNAARQCSVLSATYSPTGSYVIAGADDNVARVYRIGVAAPMHTLKGHTHKAYGIAFLSTEEQAVTGSMDAHVKLWDMTTGSCLRSEHSHTSHIFALTASPSTPHLVLSAGDDAILCVHDMRQENSVVLRMRGHTKTLWDCAVRSDDQQFASCGMDGTVRLWDPRAPLEATHTLTCHGKPVHAVQYMPSGRGILSCGKDAHVFLSDTVRGNVVWRARAQTSSVFRMRYHEDRQLLLTCGVKGEVNQWHWGAGVHW